jgi:hypothetical protein
MAAAPMLPAWDLTLLEPQPRMIMAVNIALTHLPTLFNAVLGLRKLDLSENYGLVGTIPNELAKLPQLEYLDLSATSLSGKVLFELCARVEA